MEVLVIVIVLIIVVTMLKSIFGFSIEELKVLGKNKKLDEAVNRFPENKEICKQILKMIGNEDVTIKEEAISKTSLYIAVSDTILIGNIKESFTRIQTIAHECLHSIQDRVLLLFHFYFTNVYLLYYVFIILGNIVSRIFHLQGMFWQEFVQNTFLQMFILSIFGFLFFSVRSFLEIDAMTKAEFLAKEYLEKQKIGTKEEQKEILQAYRQMNKKGIPATVFAIMKSVLVKIIVYGIFISLLESFFNNN